MQLEQHKLCDGETHELIYDYIVYRYNRKEIARLSIPDKKLYLLATDNERIVKAQEEIKAENPEYPIETFEGKFKRKES